MPKEKQFKVKAEFIFTGHFTVEAESYKEAVEIVKRDCAMTTAIGIHTNAPDETVDWDFNVHADLNIKR